MKRTFLSLLCCGSHFARALSALHSSPLKGSITSLPDTSEVSIEIINISGQRVSLLSVDNLFDNSTKHCPLHVHGRSGEALLIAKEHSAHPSEYQQILYTLPPNATFTRRVNLLNYLGETWGDPFSADSEDHITVRLPAALVGVIEDDAFEDTEILKVHHPTPINIQAEPYHMSLSKPKTRLPFSSHSQEKANPRSSTHHQRSHIKRDANARFAFTDQTLCTPDQQQQLLSAALNLPALAKAGETAANCFPSSKIPATHDPLSYFFNRGPDAQVVGIGMSAVLALVTPFNQGGQGAVTTIACAPDADDAALDDPDCTGPEGQDRAAYVARVTVGGDPQSAGDTAQNLVNSVGQTTANAGLDIPVIVICPYTWFELEDKINPTPPGTPGFCLASNIAQVLFHEMFHVILKGEVDDVCYGAQACYDLNKQDGEAKSEPGTGSSSENTNDPQPKPGPIQNADSWALFGYLAYEAGYSGPASQWSQLSNQVFGAVDTCKLD